MLKIDQNKDHNFPKTKQAWANYIRDICGNAISTRQSSEAQWARNLAYYHGFQHLSYDPVLEIVEIDRGRDNEYIINRIAPYVEQRVAKLIRTKPTLAVLPDSMDPLTIKAAELNERLLKYLWKSQHKDEKLAYAALLMVLTGCAFKKVMWNSEGGEPVKSDQDEEGNIVFDENTGSRKQNLIWLGEVENYVRSPFDILASSGVRSIESSAWIIERSQRTLIELKAMFDFDEDLVRKNPMDLSRFEKFVNNLGMPSMGQMGFGTDRRNYENDIKDNQIITVLEYWMKPNKIYPDGILSTVIGDQLVQFEEWPYDHKEYPFVKIDCIKNPFGFYGLSPVTRLIPIQRHYNQARTQIAKNAALCANIKWWAAKGCGLSDDALTDEEGEVVETNPNMPRPEQMVVAPLPNYVIESQNQDILDLRDVGGEREASQLPYPGLSAGVAIEAAAELDDLPIGPTIKEIERAMIKEGRQELMLANQCYNDERILKIFGPNKNEYSVIKFKNTDLMHQTDVTIQMESALGLTRSAARQHLVDMWDRRIISDPDIFLKAYAVGSIDVVTKKSDPTENVVIEELDMIKQGKQPVVYPFDNHVVHVKMLNDFMMTPEFRRIPQDRQQILMAVLQEHLGYLQQQMPQQPGQPQQNQAAVNTPFGQQVTEGLNVGGSPEEQAMAGEVAPQKA
jgi:hypothetical protein